VTIGSMLPGRRTMAAAIAVLCCAAVPAAASAPGPTWSGPVAADSNTPTAVNCPTTTLCVGVDSAGEVFTSATPASGGWQLDGGAGLVSPVSVSCPGGTLCVAVGSNASNVFNSASPSGHWASETVDAGTPLTGVSCPTAAACFATDDHGRVVSSSAPATQSSWAAVMIDGTAHLNGISCPTTTLCVAVDASGNVLASTSPTSGSWPTTHLTSSSLTGVSCNSSAECVAVASDGTVYATASAIGAPATWSETPLDTGGTPLSVSCTDAALCVIVDANGSALVSDTAASGSPSWGTTSIDSAALKAISCVSTGLCVAVDGSGRAVAGVEPAPTATTGSGTAASQTTATLTATVDPDDATLADCHFDYGTSSSYGASVPCASAPAPGGGAQSVSAQVTGLLASTTYHFRIVAASGIATTDGADATVTTPAPLKASPSLSGIPAVGSTLTCKPNVALAAGDTIAFAWLRDTTAIPAAASPTYVVAAADESHHLSCAVTIAGDGGSATGTSGFDAIPAQRGGKIVESYVGTAKHGGATVRAPVTCSSEAAGTCKFTLRLTTPQTVGRHRTTVVVGKTLATLKAGATQTLTVSLNPAGRRLLAKKHRIAVTLTVSGTVLGTLKATLETAKLTFTSKASTPRKKAPKHASHRHR
jgi:hypothetical protein